MQDIVLISIPTTAISHIVEKAVKKALSEAGINKIEKSEKQPFANKESEIKKEVANG